MPKGLIVIKPLISVWQRTCGVAVCLGFLASLALVGACYSSLEDAADGTSQYAQAPNSTTPGVVVGPATPLPEPTFIGINLVPHDANTLCIDGVVASGTQLTLQPCAASVLQRLKWVEGQLSVAGNRCVDIDASNGAPKAGTPVILRACDANATTQLWAYADGLIFPEVAGRTTPPSLCLSTVGASTATGAALQLASCTATPAPKAWDITLYDGNNWVGFPISSSLNAGYCFDDYANAVADGSRVQTYSCHGGPSQGITWTKGAMLLNATCLDVNGNGADDGTLVAMHSCLPGMPQQNFAYEHGRIFLPTGPNGPRCIQVPASDPTVGSQLSIITCTAASTLSLAGNLHWALGYDVRAP